MSDELTPDDRLVYLSFEADDEFLAELKVLRAEQADARTREQERFTEAVLRFKARVLGTREAVN